MTCLRHRPRHVLSSFAAPDDEDFITLNLTHNSGSFRFGEDPLPSSQRCLPLAIGGRNLIANPDSSNQITEWSALTSATKHKAGLLRMQQAGWVLSDYATLMVWVFKDNARPDHRRHLS
jgi:hypothetical protein